jgi:hypothetical protein
MKAQHLNGLNGSLLPCPHCNGPGKLAPMPGASSWWRVRCHDYHCGGTTWAMDEPAKATEAWNRRPASGPE